MHYIVLLENGSKLLLEDGTGLGLEADAPPEKVGGDDAWKKKDELPQRVEIWETRKPKDKPVSKVVHEIAPEAQILEVVPVETYDDDEDVIILLLI